LETIAILGPGVVGTALGVALRRAGHEIVAVVGRSSDSARRAVEVVSAGQAGTNAADAARTASLVLVTVPDRAIAEAARAVAAGGPLPSSTLVLHTSGYHASTELAPVAAAGGRVGSLHPLMSFATVEQALDRLPGTRCFFEGDDLDRQRAIVEDLGGVAIPIETSAKPLYHAAAATASNLLVTVVDLALSIADGAGLDREEMLDALLPLIEGSIRNVRAVGVHRALTGPISRGDSGTLAGHLEALRASAPELLPTYAALARRTVDVALRKGSIGPEAAASMLAELKNVDPPRGPE
jgi:predicted short-subunit dehydrogenase-like oxidoreductase (DUF2520 family)